MRGRKFTTNFQKVEIQAKKSGTCGKCGKKCSRSKIFGQTLNPYNKNADGKIKNRSEIMAEVEVQAKQWSLEPVYHSKCE